MSLAFYMDVHVPYPVTSALLARGVDVSAQDEERAHEPKFLS